MAVTTFTLVLKATRELAPHTRYFEFVREDGQALDFIPGQFITFLLTDSEGKTKRRSYSLANLPNAPTFELAISYVAQGFASEIFFALKPGDKLTAMGPLGKLTLSDDPCQRLILFATGTGVAPYRAMLNVFRAKMAANIKIDLVLGVRSRDYLLFSEDWLRLAQEQPLFRFHAYYSRGFPETPEAHEYAGHVQKALVSLACEPNQDRIYLCGNPGMIDDVSQVLLAQGFDKKAVHIEKYFSGVA